MYVVYGGNRSVIWTDVAQMALVWFGIFTCVTVAVTAAARRTSRCATRWRWRRRAAGCETVDLSLDLSRPYTLWSGLIGGMFLAMAYFGCDQSQVQRYLSGRSLTESRLSLLFNAFLKVPMQFLILLTGVLVFVFFHFHETPLLWNRAELARLEQQAPPAELAGCGRGRRGRPPRSALPPPRRSPTRATRAGICRRPARRTSTRSGGSTAPSARRRQLASRRRGQAGERRQLRSSRATSCRSCGAGSRGSCWPSSSRPRCRRSRASSTRSPPRRSSTSTSASCSPGGDGARDLLVSRLFTAFWGLFACAVALQAGALGSAIEVVNRFGSYFYGSILGVFGLAVLTPRARARGAFYGLFAGMATVFLVSQLTNVAFLWYNVVGALTVFVVGLLISWLDRRLVRGEGAAAG